MPFNYNPMTDAIETRAERFEREAQIDEMIAAKLARQRKIDDMSDEEFANLLRSGSDPMDAALRLLEEAA